jgi:DNA-binding response OmpR family regulator
MEKMEKILIIDDDSQLREDLIDFFTERGYDAQGVATAKEGLNKLKKEDYHVVLLDLMMPEIGGIEALRQIKKLKPKTLVIMITAFATIENAVEAMKRGASAYISKPFKIPELEVTVKKALEEANFISKYELLLKKPASDLHQVIDAIANPLRREVLATLREEGFSNFMGMVKSLGITDHTKLAFHLRNLKSSGLIEQDGLKRYFLSKKGERALEGLRSLEEQISKT